MRIKNIKLLSLGISVAVHAVFLMIPISKSYSGVFKEYEVIDFNGTDLKTQVETNILAQSSSPGRKNLVSSSDVKVDTPMGENSRGRSGGYSRLFLRNRPSKAQRGTRRILSGGKTIISPSASKLKKQMPGSGEGNLSISEKIIYPAGSSANDVRSKASAIAPYLLGVRKKIAKNWQNPYPGALPTRGLTVILSFKISPSGKISDLSVERLSKDSLFNTSVVDAIYKAAPFKKTPNGESITVKLRFQLK